MISSGHSVGSWIETLPLACTASSWLLMTTSTSATWTRRRSSRTPTTVPEMKLASPVRRRVAVLHVGVGDPAPLAAPGGDEVEHPRAHRRAVPVAARHPDVVRPPRLEVAARRSVVGAVRELGVGALQVAVALVAGHLLGVAELLAAHRRRALGHRAPRGHRVRAPLGGEAGEAVRSEDVGSQDVAGLHRAEQPLVVAEVLDLRDEARLGLVKLGELLVGPLRLTGVGVEELLLLGLADLVADRGRALQRDALALLVDVEGVAALEAGRSGERGLRDLVVVRHPVAQNLVARFEPRLEEPPLVAAEDQVRVGDPADLRRRAAVAGVGRDGERLRRDDPAEPALGGPPLVVVQRVRVVHRLHPASDVADRHRLLELARHDRHAHVSFEIGDVEATVGLVRFRHEAPSTR